MNLKNYVRKCKKDCRIIEIESNQHTPDLDER